jgi:HAD superfamily hydrolase (TIGR01490 family)
MKRIAVFDFDGTITRKDTLIEFIRFAKGSAALFWGLLLHLPWLILMKLHLYDNGKTKECVFSWFFKGMSLEQFNELGRAFYQAQADKLIYSEAKEKIEEHKSQGDIVVILSASIENWVQSFASALQAEGLLSTRAEVQNGKLTGKFATKNCYGAEKVNRLKTWLAANVNEQPYIIAYGDSRGDKELLEFANEKHYKQFKK